MALCQRVIEWGIGRNAVNVGGDAHRAAGGREELPLARHPVSDLERVALRDLVLPHDHRVVERAGVRDDARDPRADVAAVRDEALLLARAVERVRHREELRREVGARGDGDVELHPPADVDVGVRERDGLDERVDFQFLESGGRESKNCVAVAY